MCLDPGAELVRGEVHERLPLEIAWPDRVPGGERVPGRKGDDDLLLGHGDRLEPGVVEEQLREEQKVGLAGFQRLPPVETPAPIVNETPDAVAACVLDVLERGRIARM